MFIVKADVRSDRHEQLFCDNEHHIRIVYPLHEYSGEAPLVELSACYCPTPVVAAPPLLELDDAPKLKPSKASKD